MPNIRVMLWAALAAILFLNYEAWMQDYPASPAIGAPASSTAAGSNAPANKLGDSVPQAAAPSAAAPAAAKAETAAPLGGAPMPAPVDAASPKAGADHSPGAPVHVVTDVLDIVVSLKGGELERADLLQYPLHKDTPNVPVRLLNGDSDDLYLLQTGLTPAAGEAAPTHLATWTSPETSYSLPAGAAEIRVPLSWTDGFGLTVVKTFTFKRGSYAVDLTYDLQNDGSAARSVAAYSQFLRHWVHASRSYFDVETYSFKGPAVYDGTKARDLKVENEADGKFSETVTNGWIASLQHHFVSAIVPQAGQATTLKLQVQGQEYLLSATGPMIAIPAGGRTRIEEKLFIGPKLQEQLAAAGPRLDLTADYGLLTVLAHPLFVTLKWIHGLVGNWGWAIIIVTALIKLLFYPLSQASGRSMAKMRAIAPRMKQIQDRSEEHTSE